MTATTAPAPAAAAARKSFRPAPERLRGERNDRIRMGKNLIPFGVSYLDDVCRGILPSDLVLLGAKSGVGKTALASAVAQGAASRGLSVFFFALEAEFGEIERRSKYRYLVNRLWQTLPPQRLARLNYLDWLIGRCDDITGPYEADADEEIAERYASLQTFYRSAHRFDNARLAKLLDALREQAQLVVIDHLHYIDGRENEGENAALKGIVQTVRDFALTFRKPVIVVAHLRKSERGRVQLVPDLDDFHGSSDVPKIATRVITLSPANDQPRHRAHLCPTYMAVRKDRPGGVNGLVALCRFNLQTFSYERSYRLGRLSFAGDTWAQMADQDLPRWALNAVGQRGADA